MGSGVREVLSAMSTLFLQASRWQAWWHSTWAVKASEQLKAEKAQRQLCRGSLPPKRHVATKQRLCLWGTMSIVNESNRLRSSGIVTVIQRILRNQELQDLRSSLGFFFFFLMAGWGGGVLWKLYRLEFPTCEIGIKTHSDLTVFPKAERWLSTAVKTVFCAYWCVRHSVQHFACPSSLKCHRIPRREVLLLCTLCRWEN